MFNLSVRVSFSFGMRILWQNLSRVIPRPARIVRDAKYKFKCNIQILSISGKLRYLSISLLYVFGKLGDFYEHKRETCSPETKRRMGS